MSDPAPNFQFIASQLRKPAGKYASTVTEGMDETNEALFDLTLDTLDVRAKEHLLEIGFGSGKFLQRLCKKASGVKISGLDYSLEMVKMATANNKDAVAAGQLVLEHGSSDKIPFPNGAFDKVFCNMVIFFWDDPARHLREIHRVLRPDGKFYTGLRPKRNMKNFPFTEFGFHLYEPREWIEVLERNGFDVLEVADRQDPENKNIPFILHSYCIVAKK